MKKFLATIAAAALIVPGAAYAQHPDTRTQTHQTQTRSTETPQKKRTNTTTTTTTRTTTTKTKTTSHSFKKGSRFSRSKAPNYRRVSYRESSRLSTPPSGYTWVRAGNDVLLVKLSNNIVARVVTNVF